MSHLLATKLFVPRRRPNSVERTRLTEQLAAGVDRKLTLVSAPAGFGKTTLMSQWIPRSARCVTWVSLDKGDNDPASFWQYVIAALQLLRVDIGQKALVLLQSPHPPPIQKILTVLLNEIADFPDKFALVLDDYQVIQSPSIHIAILFLLEHGPPHMHLVIAGRTDPPIPLGRLRARDELTEIRTTDLRFTPDETAFFLKQTMGLNLSTENTTALEQYTEGWIAGLQLAGLAIQGHNPQPNAPSVPEFVQSLTGSHRYLVSYLVEEVLSQRPKGTMDFLLQTSILDSLSGPLCDHVLGKVDGHSQSILERLEHANLFLVPLDEEGKWYRYHHLFAEVLRARLQFTQPGRMRHLHLRASEWHQQSGAIPDSVRHALEAQEWERAAKLIEEHGIAFGSKGRMHFVLSWLSALPEPVLQSHPLLCIFYAGALMYKNRFEDAAARLRDAEGAVQVDTPADQARVILGRVSMVRSNLCRMQGDITGCVRLSEHALELLPASDRVPRANAHLSLAHRFLTSGDVTPESQALVTSALNAVNASGNAYLAQRGKTLLARFCAMQGHLHRSEEIYADDLSGQTEATFVTGNSDHFFGLGDLNREWNRLDEAEEILGQGVIQARSFISDGDAMMRGYQSLARLKQVRGDTQGAMATLDEFAKLAQEYHFADEVLTSVGAVRAWLDLMVGNVAAAAQWADTRGISTGDDLTYPREREYLTLARLLIRSGGDDPGKDGVQQALELLDRLAAAAQAGSRMGSLIETLVLRTMAFDTMGDRSEALKSLEQALTLACPEGYTRVFLDEGEAIRPLLAEFVRTSLGRTPNEKQHNPSAPLLSYADRLVAAFPGGAHTAPENGMQQVAHPDLLEPLSDRELDVLRLIATGASNAAISAVLNIALSTVKRHAGSLYGKLGVNSRTQAIVRSQALGLLS